MEKEIDYNKLATAVVEALKQGKHVLWIDPETHAEHHEFIGDEMEKRAKTEKLIDDTKAKAVGWVVVGSGGGFIAFIGWAIIKWLETHGMKF